MVTLYLDPRSSKVFQDPFFMLQQNDFIITQYDNASIMQSDVQRWMPWISMSVSLVSLVVTIALLVKR